MNKLKRIYKRFLAGILVGAVSISSCVPLLTVSAAESQTVAGEVLVNPKIRYETLEEAITATSAGIELTKEEIVDNDYVLYMANCGTTDPLVVPNQNIERMGILQSSVDQELKEDPNTGAKWGRNPATAYSKALKNADDATDIGNSFIYMSDGSDVTFDKYKSGLGYSFEVPTEEITGIEKDTYEVTVAFKHFWEDREVNICMEGETVATDVALNTGQWVSKTFTVKVTDGELNVDVKAPRRTGPDEDPVLNYIKVEAVEDRDPVIPNYTSITGTDGAPMYDNNGNQIQAHGGQVQQLTVEGVTKWYWIGEDKTNDYRPVGGIRMYSSTDLYNWVDEGSVLKTMENPEQFETDNYFKEVYGTLSDGEKAAIFEDLDKNNTVMERPKMIYNDRTGKYVIWFHCDGRTAANDADYGKAKAGIAISDSPTGPFKLLGSYKLHNNQDEANGRHGYDGWEGRGSVRDMTLFKDDDGTGYVIYSSEGNETTFIAKLNADYTWLSSEPDKGVEGVGKDFTRNFAGWSREAPAMFKYRDKYYIINSGCTGWSPNPAEYFVADHPMGPYKGMGDPCTDWGSGTTYDTQSTCVIPVDPENGKYIYMGDRWFAGNLRDSRYVWIPVEFRPDDKIALGRYEDWTLKELEGKGLFNVVSDLPTTAKSLAQINQKGFLPETVQISYGTDIVETPVPVTWTVNETSEEKIGTVTVMGTVAEKERTFTHEIHIVNPNTQYFFDSGALKSTEQKTDYYNEAKTILGDTLKNSQADQAYTEENHAGYLGRVQENDQDTVFDIGVRSGTTALGNGWWANEGKTIDYAFDLEPGKYKVAAGFQEWWNTTRPMRMTITASDEKGQESTLDKKNFTLWDNSSDLQVNQTFEVTQAGTVKVSISKTANEDPVLSWIAIMKDGEVGGTAQDIADSISSIPAPVKGATQLRLPSVPVGFTIEIKSSDSPTIMTDGTIVLPSVDTTVNLVLEITRLSDNTKATTGSISVTVPVDEQSAVMQFMDYFQPMPIIEKLSTDCWGANEVGPRDQGNGLEDRYMSDYSYWDGGIIKDEETSKYYMFASRWKQEGGLEGENGYPGWKGSKAVYAVSDNLYGPYEDQGLLWPDYYEGAGHNVAPFTLSEKDTLYQAGYRYAIVIADVHSAWGANGSIQVTKSLKNGGDWKHLGPMDVDTSRFGLTNISITERADGRYEAINRNGDIAVADSVGGPWEVLETELWWKVTGMPTENIEDPVIWYLDGLYHCVVNKWDTKQAYYLTSKDGIKDWTLHEGKAYTPSENFLSYVDGTKNNWTALERPNVYIEDGKLKAMLFAVVDVEKWDDHGNDQHGSKIIVIPFDGDGLKEFAKRRYEGLLPVADTNTQTWEGEVRKNYGAEKFIQVQRDDRCAGMGEGESEVENHDCKIGFFKYDVSQYSLFKPEKKIESAYLSLVYLTNADGNSEKNRFRIVLTDSEWEEGNGCESNGNVAEPGSLTGENQPQMYYDVDDLEGTSVVSEEFAIKEGLKEIKIDVTKLIEEFMEISPDSQYLSFAVNETESGNRLKLGTKESGEGYAARLIINLGEEQPQLVTAQEVADSITKIETPVKGATQLKLPSVPEGFVVGIQSSDSPTITTGGAIVLPDVDTTVNLVLEITKLSDDTTATTGSISVIVLACQPEGVNKRALELLILEGEQKEESDYKPETWAIFEDALAEAKNIQGNEDASQYEVDAAVDILQSAIDQLELEEGIIDRSRLKALIDVAEDYNESDYTSDSWELFASALANAQSIVDEVEADQDTIDEAANGLKTAMDQLVKKAIVDKSSLEQLVNKAIQLQNDAAYTENSRNWLQVVISQGQDVLDDESATQDDVYFAETELKNVITSLIPFSLEQSVLEAIASSIDFVNKTKYTAKSRNQLRLVIESAEEMLQNNYASINDFEETLIKIRQAVANLVIHTDATDDNGGSSGSNGGQGSSKPKPEEQGGVELADEKINEAIANKKTIEVVLKKNETSVKVTGKQLKKMIEENSTLTIKKDNISITMNPKEIIGADMNLNGIGDILIDVKAYGDTITEKMFGNVNKIDEINKKLLLATAYDIVVMLDGKKIDNYTNQQTIVFDLSRFDLTEAQIKNLTGVQYGLADEYQKSGGYYNAEDKTFTIKIDGLGKVGVIVSENLMKLSLGINQTTYSLNDELKTLEVGPTIIDGRTMVPLRFIMETLDSKVAWDKDTRIVTITLEDKVLMLTIGETVPGMDVAPVIINNRTMVPLRYISETSGYTVVWNELTQVIDIFK